MRLIDLSLDQLSTNSLLCWLRYDSSPCPCSSSLFSSPGILLLLSFRLLAFFFFSLFISWHSSSSLYSSPGILLLSFHLLAFFFFSLFVSWHSSSSLFSSPDILLLLSFRLLAFFFFSLFVSWHSSSSLYSSPGILLLLSIRLLAFFFFFSPPSSFILPSLSLESLSSIYRETEKEQYKKRTE